MSHAPMLEDTSRTEPGFMSSTRTPSTSTTSGVLLIRTFTIAQCVSVEYTNTRNISRSARIEQAEYRRNGRGGPMRATG